MPPQSSGGAEAEVARILKERVERLRAGLDTLTRGLLEPIPLPRAADHPESLDLPRGDRERADSDSLAESVRALAASEDQISLLDRLLEGTAGYFSRVCLFIVREETAHGWCSVGFPETETGDPAKNLSLSLKEDSILRAAAQSLEPVRQKGQEGASRFLPAPRPGDRLPGTALAVPLLVREKVAAVLYADDGGDGRSLNDAGSVEVLASVASLAANQLALMSRPASEGAAASAVVEVRIPSVQEAGCPAAGPDPLGIDPLEEDLSPAAAAAPAAPAPGNLSPEEALLHEDARRFARLLVSELLLYNEDLVIMGRKQRDIYSQLKEEIDRSRQAYEQRVARSVSAKADYLKEEMVRTLAGGDPTVLGPGLAD